jgi:hypothetical protein
MARNDNFFGRLTRLFRSGPSIQRKVKGYNYNNYFDNDVIRGNYGYRAPFPFGKESSPFSTLGAYGLLDRMSRYAEFGTMEYTPEMATALNIYADEVTSGDERGRSFHVFSSNPEIKRALDELFYDILNIDYNLRPWVRNMAKYGDFFLYNEVVPDIGVVNAQPIRVNELEREEGFDPNDPYAVRFKWLTRGNKYLENWQVSHFRILGNDMFLPYGTSILESARRVWRQLIMMEDSMLTYRIVRSPERRVFYVDVSHLAPNDIGSYMEQVKQTLRAQDVVSRPDGRIDQRYSPQAIIDDYFIPRRGTEDGTKIETLAGGQNTTAIEDVEYLQKKLFAAVQVPKAYLNFDENLTGKASLAQMDVRFSRTISSFQKIVIAELNKLAMIHLYAKGFNEQDLMSFDLRLSNPSILAMLQKLENLNSKIDIAQKYKDSKLVDELWVQKNILELSDDELRSVNKGLRVDKIKEVELDAIAVAQSTDPEPAKSTDPFNPSGYSIPGADVPKNPPVEDTSVELDNFSKIVDYNDQDASGSPENLPTTSLPSLAGKAPPIQPSPFVKRDEKNRQRRVGAGGRRNLGLPDLGGMLSGKSRSLTDIYDKGFLTSPLTEESIDDQISKDFSETEELPVLITKEIRSIFKHLEVHLVQKRASGVLLSESTTKDDGSLLEVSMTEDEILVESVAETEVESSEDTVDLTNLD